MKFEELVYIMLKPLALFSVENRLLNTVNRSELETKDMDRRQAWENAGKQGTGPERKLGN